MAKYDPLRQHLARLTAIEWTPRFDEIEAIIGSPLPASASTHRTWWANSGGLLVHQEAWLNAGWRVRAVDIASRSVTFQRQRISAPAAPRRTDTVPRGQPEAGDGLPLGFRKTLDASRKPVNLSARIDWTEIGPAVRGANGWRLPPAAAVPALCRFHVLRDGAHRILVVITRDFERFLRAVEGGETDARTAARAREVADAIAGADHVVVDAATPGQAWILVDGRGHKADLDNDDERWLVAWAAAIGNRQAGVEAVLVAR